MDTWKATDKQDWRAEMDEHGNIRPKKKKTEETG